MYVQILLALIVGVLCGIITGIFPGIHVNLVATTMFALSPILLGSALLDLSRINSSSSSDRICPPEIS